MQPQPERIENQQETTTNHPEPHGETTKDNNNQHQTRTQDNKTMNNTQELLDTKTGWVEPAYNSTQPAHSTTKTTQDLINFAIDMKKNGLAETTIISRIRTLKQLARMTDLQDTEAAKATITSHQQWNKLTQRKHAEMYEAFLRFTGKTWKRPHIKPETRLPFIPTETEIDQLIASCAKHTATLLQTLKETGIRISEAAKLHWIDLSTEQKTLNITPTKGSNPRILPISTKLIDMINQMPQNRETIFGTHTQTN